MVNTRTLETGKCFITGHEIPTNGLQDEERMDDCPIGGESNDSEWIPVEERSPEDLEEVLVWYEYAKGGDPDGPRERTYGIGYIYEGHWMGGRANVKCEVHCLAAVTSGL